MAKARPSSVRSLPTRATELAEARELIERIVDECPRRLAGTESERHAHDLLARQLAEQGIACEFKPFRFHDNLYGNLTLHFGLGTAGSMLFGSAPALALVCHTLAGVSYYGDTNRQFHLLRRFLPRRHSQNLIATLPARGKPRLRIVVMSHIDAANTGAIFNPWLVERLMGDPQRSPGPLGKPLKLATYCQFALAGLDVAGILMGPARRLLWPAVGVLSLPGLVLAAVNAEVVLRDEVVPGANDNLSACAAQCALARRLAAWKPADMELVFVSTGAEESGTLGSQALARQMRGEWDRDNTVILAIDGLANGDLQYFHDGEIRRFDLPPWLTDTIEQVAGGNNRYAAVGEHDMYMGATDAMPFAAAGYDAVGLGCIDPRLSTPRHYHVPADTPANLDYDQLMLSIDFIEDLVKAIHQRRSSGPRHPVQ